MPISVIAGAYDGTLHGWQGPLEDLKLVFAFKAHESCIKVVDADGKLACSAGTDQSIQLYDLGKRKIIDRMSGVHENAVSAVAFTRDKDGTAFLLSGDANGKLFVWNVKEQKVIHDLKGHKQDSPVTSIAVHPSGRVALSTARDNSLRMWDLVKGKAAPRIKLDDFKELSCACWSPDDGQHYAVVGDERVVVIFEALSTDGKALGTFAHPRRVNALQFVQDVALVSACDDGALRLFGVDGTLIRTLQLESSCRVRDFGFISEAAQGEEEEEDGDAGVLVVAGAFSDGTIRIWDLNEDSDEALAALNVGTGAHLTSVKLSLLPEPKQVLDKPHVPSNQKSKRMKKQQQSDDN